MTDGDYPKQTSEMATDKLRTLFPVGMRVEVKGIEEEGMPGSWFAGKVKGYAGGKAKVEFEKVRATSPQTPGFPSNLLKAPPGTKSAGACALFCFTHAHGIGYGGSARNGQGARVWGGLLPLLRPPPKAARV